MRLRPGRKNTNKFGVRRLTRLEFQLRPPMSGAGCTMRRHFHRLGEAALVRNRCNRPPLVVYASGGPVDVSSGGRAWTPGAGVDACPTHRMTAPQLTEFFAKNPRLLLR